MLHLPFGHRNFYIKSMKSYTKNLFRFKRAVCCGLLLFSLILGNKAWAIVEVNPEDVIVEPMITTHWYQMDPYWDLVPRYEDTGLQHYSGCQAYEKAPFWKNFTIIADL